MEFKRRFSLYVFNLEFNSNFYADKSNTWLHRKLHKTYTFYLHIYIIEVIQHWIWVLGNDMLMLSSCGCHMPLSVCSRDKFLFPGKGGEYGKDYASAE